MITTHSTYLALMGIERWQLRRPHLLPIQKVSLTLADIPIQLLTAPKPAQWLVLATDANELGLTDTVNTTQLWQALWHAAGLTLADIACGIIAESPLPEAISLHTVLQQLTPAYLVLMGSTVHQAMLTKNAILGQNQVQYDNKTGTAIICLPSLTEMLHQPLQKRAAMQVLFNIQDR